AVAATTGLTAGITHAHRLGAAAATAGGSRHHRLLLALHGRAVGGNHVHAATMVCDDAVELGERLDLVDDHLAHLRGGFGGLLRHFQHAAAQLVAGRFQL